MQSRGIRGATTAEANTRESILSNTQELLEVVMAANDLKKDDLVCAFLTTTRDLNAEFPAVAARQLGWTDVALMCGHEMDVPGALTGVIRVMLVVNTEQAPDKIVHVYLKEAKTLRPDTVSGTSNRTDSTT
jgi:chorismate mutase